MKQLNSFHSIKTSSFLLFSIIQILLIFSNTGHVFAEEDITQHLSSPSKCPVKCICNKDEKSVGCSFSGLMRIPKGLPSDTKTLYLDHNLIGDLSPEDFENLQFLQHLYLNDNAISYIKDATFSGLPNLLELSLSNNQMSTINLGVFSGLNKLEHLWMSQIHSPGTVPCIKDRTFSSLPSLRTLDIANNDLYFISKDLFAGLSKLTNLSLTLNLLSKVDALAFTGVGTKKASEGNESLVVDLGPYYTGICCCSTAEAISSLRNHSETYCTVEKCSDYVTSICGMKYNGTCLKETTPPHHLTTPKTPSFRLHPSAESTASAKINTSPVTVGFIVAGHQTTPQTNRNAVPVITTQRISVLTTPYEEPPQEIPTSPRKRGVCSDKCRCYDNFQTVVCKQFMISVPADLPAETRKLVLNDNRIARIRKYDFYDMSNLRELYLHNNKIRKIEDGSFSNLRHLESLFLLNNQIKKISQSTFNGLKNLKTLWISSMNSDENLISIQDGSFQNLTRLESLLLNNNKFLSLTESTFVGLDNLKMLSISVHLIQVLSEKTFDVLPKNASVQTGAYEIKVCCCSSAVALNNQRIARVQSVDGTKTKCTVSTCVQNEIMDVCRIKKPPTLTKITTLKPTSFTETDKKIDGDFFETYSSMSISNSILPSSSMDVYSSDTAITIEGSFLTPQKTVSTDTFSTITKLTTTIPNKSLDPAPTISEQNTFGYLVIPVASQSKSNLNSNRSSANDINSESNNSSGNNSNSNINSNIIYNNNNNRNGSDNIRRNNIINKNNSSNNDSNNRNNRNNNSNGSENSNRNNISNTNNSNNNDSNNSSNVTRLNAIALEWGGKNTGMTMSSKMFTQFVALLLTFLCLNIMRK